MPEAGISTARHSTSTLTRFGWIVNQSCRRDAFFLMPSQRLREGGSTGTGSGVGWVLADKSDMVCLS